MALTEVLHRLAHDEGERTRYLSDPAGYAATLPLSAEEREGLARMQESELLALGVHPFVPFMARLQLDRQRGS